jgi:hypothetical protein
VLSHDRKWHNESPNVAAIKQHNIACFYLWGASAPIWEKLRCFVSGYDRIVAAIESTARPFIFDITRNGRLAGVSIP